MVRARAAFVQGTRRARPPARRRRILVAVRARPHAARRTSAPDSVMISIKVPPLGESIVEATISSW